jgi:hypothetical protein
MIDVLLRIARGCSLGLGLPLGGQLSLHSMITKPRSYFWVKHRSETSTEGARPGRHVLYAVWNAGHAWVYVDFFAKGL